MSDAARISLSYFILFYFYEPQSRVKSLISADIRLLY